MADKLLQIIAQDSGNQGITGLRQFCINSHTELVRPLTGILSILVALGLLVEHESSVTASSLGLQLIECEEVSRRRYLEELLCNHLVAESIMGDLLPRSRLRYDHEQDAYLIHIGHIPLKYGHLRNFLEASQLLVLDVGTKKALYLSSALTRILEGASSEGMPSEINRLRRVTSLDDLRNILAAQQVAGERAEVFVLEFEKRRLHEHPLVERIKVISQLDVSAGYDLVSFESPTSEMIDRFIEVKSYKGQMRFFWSRNEVEVAKRLGDKYYIYLVDSNRITSADYSPEIICNPAEHLFKSESWVVEPQSWQLTRI